MRKIEVAMFPFIRIDEPPLAAMVAFLERGCPSPQLITA